eukprot:TRINITY_DN4415_c0_g1_i1.p1 TRINITY_DN4415_c0_g1~~TRINITY_DN4415_c0_g1_i1.p1  ORF type:complete len:692 (+),score=201.56 TRINITY_DN4415_c0_g1_i1:157-2232(+)
MVLRCSFATAPKKTPPTNGPPPAKNNLLRNDLRTRARGNYRSSIPRTIFLSLGIGALPHRPLHLRGVDQVADFKEEFGLVPVDPAEEAEDTPAADTAEPAVEPAEVAAAEGVTEAQDAAEPTEAEDAPAAETAEELEEAAAVEDVKEAQDAEGEEGATVEVDVDEGEFEAAEAEDGDVAAVPEAAPPASEAEEEERARMSKYEPDAASEALSASFGKHRRRAAPPQPRYVIAEDKTSKPAARSTDGPLEHPLPGAVEGLRAVPGAPEASAVVGVEAAEFHTATGKYAQLQRMYNDLCLAGAGAGRQWVVPMILLRDTLRALVEARVHTFKGASGFGDGVGLETLCELAALHCRPYERIDTEEHKEANPPLVLREGVTVAYGGAARSNKSRFPPPAPYREHLAQLDALDVLGGGYTKESFLDVHAALAPLLTTLATLGSRDLARRHAAPAAGAAPEGRDGAAPPPPVHAGAHGASTFTTHAEKHAGETEPTARIPAIRSAHLSSLIFAAQGEWHTEYNGSYAKFQVIGRQIRHINDINEDGSAKKPKPIGRLDIHEGEITWETVAESKKATAEPIRYKLVHAWEDEHSYSSKLKSCKWIHPNVDEKESPCWYRDATRFGRKMHPSARAQRKDEREEMTADSEGKPQQAQQVAAFADYRETGRPPGVRPLPDKPASNLGFGAVPPPPSDAASA